jgi:hypothetical protein
MNIDDIRLENLATVIRDHFGGRQVRLADALNRQSNSISRYFSKSRTNHRAISDNTAREVETLLSLPGGWMDIRHTTAPDEPMTDEVRELIKNYNLADSRGRRAILETAKREAAATVAHRPAD